jgi:hypothetical protein
MIIMHSVCLICGETYRTQELASSVYPQQPIGEPVLSHGICPEPECKREYVREFCGVLAGAA